MAASVESLKGWLSLGATKAMAIARSPLTLPLVVFLAALWAVTTFFPSFQQQSFMWSHNFNSAVAFACGRGFGEIMSSVPSMNEFLRPGSASFDCADLPQDLELGDLNAYASGIPYFLQGLGFYWSIVGISWDALVPLMAFMFALSSALAFLLFRQFFGPIVALVLAGIFISSPIHFFSLTYYEHYTKTPFFLAIMLALSWLVLNEASTRLFYVKALVVGVLLGIGFGIRADLWLLAAPALAAIMFFPKLRNRPLWRHKAIAAAVFVVTAGVVALPAMTTGGTSYFWMQLVQGLSSPIDRELGVTRGAYEWVPLYSDNMALSWMETYSFYQIEGQLPSVADAFPVEGQPSPGTSGWRNREVAGRDAYLTIMSHFPADFLTRPLAAVRALISGSLSNQESYVAQIVGEDHFFARTRMYWRSLTGLTGGGALLIVLLIAGLFGLSLRDRPAALFFTLLVLWVGGTAAIVFLPRHHWHLYIIGFFALGAALKGLVMLAQAAMRALSARRIGAAWAPLAASPRNIGISAAWTGGLVIAALAVILSAHAIQGARATGLATELLAAEATPVVLAREETETGARYTMTSSTENFWRQAFAVSNFAYGQYYRATFSHRACGDTVEVRLAHDATGPFYDDTRSIWIEFQPGTERATLIFPAYFMQQGLQYGFLKAVELDNRAEGCLETFERFDNPAELPILVTWVLPENWRAVPLRQQFAH